MNFNLDSAFTIPVTFRVVSESNDDSILNDLSSGYVKTKIFTANTQLRQENMFFIWPFKFSVYWNTYEIVIHQWD